MNDIYTRIILIISIFCLLLVGCGKPHPTSNKIDDKKPLYELYATTSGNLAYFKIFSIQPGKVDYKKKIHNLRTAEKNLTLTKICKTTSNKVLGTVYHNKRGNGLNNKVVVFKDGEIQEIVKFDRSGTHDIISDPEKDLSYIGFVLQPARYNPNGTPYRILKGDKEIKPFALKGSCEAYCIGDNYIYAFVDAFKELGYKDTPEKYLATINRDTQEVKIINSNIKYHFGSLAYNQNKKEIWGVYKDINNNWASKIVIYKEDGSLKKEINLDIPLANNIYINKKGIAYISHGDYMGDINCINAITIYDTNTEKYIGKIDMPKGPEDMSAMDNYLFVSNCPSNSISIIDMDKNQLVYTIKNITGNDKSSINESVVIKP